MNFEYMCEALGGTYYNIRLKNPNKAENNSVEVYGILQLMQKHNLSKLGETQDFDGEFYCKEKLPENVTLLLENSGKLYELLIKYDMQNAGNSLIDYSHMCYRLREYGNAN